MSVEDYLNSIRKNTNSTTKKTSAVDSTIKELLNYEALKRAVKDGVIKGNEEQFRKLSELSRKILTSSDATASELQEINQLLKLFYSEIPKNSSGNTQVALDSWIKALKEILDEFGNSLPEKFQKRLKYDIVASASEGGANPRQVFQQLNQQQNIQINQTLVLNNIYSLMKDQKQLTDRKAEAEKPVKDQKEKEQKTWWQNTMGRVTGFLRDITDKLSTAGKALGLLYVGLGIWNSLSESVQGFLRDFSAVNITAKLGVALSKLMPSLSGLFGKIKLPSWLTNLATASKGSNALKLTGNMPTSTLSKIEGFFLRFKAILNHSIREALPTISKVIKELFPTFSKVFKWIGAKGKLIFDIYQKIAPGLKIVGSWISKVFGWIARLAKFLPLAIRVGSSILKFIPMVGWILQGIISLADFIEGFKIDGIKGGFRRMGVEFVAVFGDLASFVVKGLVKLVASIANKTGLFKDTLENLNKILGGIDSWKSSIRTGVGYDGSSSGGVAMPSTSTYDPVSSTVFMGQDSYNELLPLASAAKGTTPANAEGIRKASGVKLSAQTSDFIKRAGITNKITSGMEGVHAGTAKNPRSHASGNKFDMDISTKSATAFANEVRKLLKTPGLVEIRTESVPNSIVETARAMLKKEGLNVSKLINDGYPSYSTGPHLDVLIDPKYSGVAKTAQTPDFSTTVTSLADTGESKNTNPLVAQITEQLTKAFNEQSKLFEKGAKAPDQLSSTQNKANTSAIIKNLSSKSSGNAVTFNKQNDINDANLAALEILTLV